MSDDFVGTLAWFYGLPGDPDKGELASTIYETLHTQNEDVVLITENEISDRLSVDFFSDSGNEALTALTYFCGKLLETETIILVESFIPSKDWIQRLQDEFPEMYFFVDTRSNDNARTKLQNLGKFSSQQISQAVDVQDEIVDKLPADRLIDFESDSINTIKENIITFLAEETVLAHVPSDDSDDNEEVTSRLKNLGYI